MPSLKPSIFESESFTNLGLCAPCGNGKVRVFANDHDHCAGSTVDHKHFGYSHAMIAHRVNLGASFSSRKRLYAVYQIH